MDTRKSAVYVFFAMILFLLGCDAHDHGFGIHFNVDPLNKKLEFGETKTDEPDSDKIEEK